MLYPENLFNRVTYTYGKAGDKYNRAGRLALVEDASGGEAYYYGKQGEVTKTVRTVMASVADIRTYVYGATYDSWNRVQTMTYPDGEVVTYHYNAAGQVESMTSNKQGRQSVIVDRIGSTRRVIRSIRSSVMARRLPIHMTSSVNVCR